MRAQNGGFELEALPSCLGLAQYGLHDAALLWRKNCGPKPSISDAVCETQNPSVFFPKYFANAFFPLKMLKERLIKPRGAQARQWLCRAMSVGVLLLSFPKSPSISNNHHQHTRFFAIELPHFGRRVNVGARLGQRKAKAAFFS